MKKRTGWLIFFLITLFSLTKAYGQQDVDFHLNAHLLPGKKILKVKRDFYDPYLWVLAQNNEVYRVNSLTQAIDDYSAKFANYNNIQFVDIAGRDADTVFVATNSNNVIRYKNGIINLISQDYSARDTVNSIGVEYFVTNQASGKASTLLIATNNGNYYYNMDSGQPPRSANRGYSKVYEATYRRGMFADSGFNYNSTDTLTTLPAYAFSNHTVYATDLLEGKSFGYNIHTAYFVDERMYDDPDVIYQDVFWGNDRGMFQAKAQDNYLFDQLNAHYLDGITVNKITGIYGLTSFGDGHQWGNPGFIKENLLVGTNQGLYFTNSLYGRSGIGGFRFFSLFHFDDLGSIKVNDICVNARSTTEPICEDGVYVASDDGLYLLKSDYSKYLTTQNLAAVNFKGQPDTLSQMHVCVGASATAAINNAIYTGHTIAWYKNGNLLPGQIQDTLAITTTGEYYAFVYDPCENTKIETNHLKVDVSSGPIFTFNYPDKIQQCNNNPYILKTDNTPGYHYQWYTNGTLNGDTTSSYTVTQTGKYRVEVGACTNSWVPSKEVEVDLITLPVPQITPDKAIYCAEDIATLSTNTPTDPGYTINWYLDGNLVPADKDLTSIKTTAAGSYTASVNSTIANCSQTSAPLLLSFAAAPAFSSKFPDEARSCSSIPLNVTYNTAARYHFRWYADGVLNRDTTASCVADKTGKYKVEMSSCAGSWVSSNEIQIDIVQLPVPVITAGKPAYCTGDNATLSVSAPLNASYTINWYRDNVLLPGNNNQTSLTTNTAGNYTVSVVNNLLNYDGTTCSETSVVQSLSFNPPPTVSIEKIVKTTICDGQTIDLLAHYNGGTIKWSTGESTGQISITTAGNYKATVTSVAGCVADTSIVVAFLPNPVLNIKDTSVCTYKQQSITLNAPPGFSQYAWNGQPGGQTYQVSIAQTVNLTVTDANGCQATRQVKVIDKCPDVWIPNTFTPNGDGINDTWVIEGLGNDQTVLVRVFTRYGTQIYESKGYGVPWNGGYNGKRLPPGTYYYLVNAKNGSQKFSGPLTIIY